MNVSFTIPGEIVPWARAGARGAQRFTPQRQKNYQAVIKSMAAEAMAGRLLIEGPVEMKIMATWPWPKAIPPKRRNVAGAGRKPTKPDVDNIAKIVKDALNLIVWKDDAQVWSLHAWKCWGDRPGLMVSIEAL